MSSITSVCFKKATLKCIPDDIEGVLNDHWETTAMECGV